MTTHPLIIVGDCIDVMRSLPDASVDAVITDPPYGLSFMGKGWDAPQEQHWHESWAAECLRLLKPGGHLLAFGGTRTAHRMTCAIEDAGFEIRDTLAWLYGSGFPKSLDVSKAIDKAAGAAREVVGDKLDRPGYHLNGHDGGEAFGHGLSSSTPETRLSAAQITAPATAGAQAWQGWGTALKPAHEPITLARKPLTGTVAANVLKHGTGALNIDACRIEGAPRNPGFKDPESSGIWGGSDNSNLVGYESPDGRWPANVILSHHPDCTPTGETRSVKADGHHPAQRGGLGSERTRDGGIPTGQEGLVERYADGETVEVWECHADCAVRLLDEQSGTLASGALDRSKITAPNKTYGAAPIERTGTYAPNKGGASRFYYVAKASKRERGGEHNTHPTVKPIALMRWLVRLVAPPGALILDPFLGSGTTALACIAEGVEWVGIEQDQGYAEIATQRINAAEAQA